MPVRVSSFLQTWRKNHPLWQRGLGLHCSDGGLRAEYIQTGVPEEALSDFVASTFVQEPKPDARLQSREAAECQVHHDVCFAVHSQCSQNLNVSSVKVLVGNLGRLIRERSLSPASLLKVFVDGSSVSCLYFLGVSPEKPCMQTLVQAKVVGRSDEGDHVSLHIDPETKLARVISSHQLFQSLVGDSDSPDFDYVHIDVLDYDDVYSAGLWKQDGTCVSYVVVTSSTPHLISIKRPPPKRRVKANLPFGLKLPNKPRKKAAARPRAQGSSKSKVRRAAMDSGSDTSSSGSSSSDSQSSDSAMSVSKTSASKSSDSDTTTSESSDSELSNVETEDEVVPHPTAAVCEEAVVMMHLQEEIEQQDAAEAGIQQDIDSHRQVRPGSTYFSSHVGLAAGAIAPTNRSRCHHCKALIAKDSVRFEFFYSARRPPHWMHSGCVAPHVLAASRSGNAEMLSQARLNLQRVAESSVDERIVEAAIAVIEGLL